jgi:hypothetical protein
MDWTLAINRNRDALQQIVLALFAMIGLSEDARLERLPAPLYRAVLALLRPAEAAVRRLIVVAARGLVVKAPAVRAAPPGPIVRGKGEGRISFRLHDPRPRLFLNRSHRRRGPEPRIHFFGGFDPRVPLFRTQVQILPSAPEPDTTVRARPLCWRLMAIKGALEDLPRQARRYVRWLARPLEKRRPSLFSTLRPGAPPGLHRKPGHEVHQILSECHWLARNLPDTS